MYLQQESQIRTFDHKMNKRTLKKTTRICPKNIICTIYKCNMYNFLLPIARVCMYHSLTRSTA